MRAIVEDDLLKRLHDHLNNYVGYVSNRELKLWNDTVDVINKLLADKKDAERYRWLRSQHWSESKIFVVVGKDNVRLGTDCPTLLRLDDTIDQYILKAGTEKDLK